MGTLNLRLDGRTAIVTGASRGIGRALALGLAEAGATVAVNYATRVAEADAVVAEIERAGGRAVAIQADVSRDAEVRALVATAVEQLGTPTILVNNAGLTDVHKPWHEIDEAEWDRVLAVNLKGCFLCFRAVHPHMAAAGWGRVINVSSVTFWLGRPNLAHYVSSKAGMIGFTRTLAREVGTEGITVNAITPGAIRTASEMEMFPDQAGIAAWLSEAQAIKRRGVPQDVAGAAVFLASDSASFITGQTLNIDGGWAMH